MRRSVVRARPVRLCSYCSIPQSNESEQLEAIKSLPGYVSCATAFVIVAPTVRHSNKDEDCDLQSYRTRMWCRVEQLCFLMANSADAMFVCTGDDAAAVTPASQDTSWLRENLYVFEGVATDEGDKLKLVTPLLGLYASMLLREEEQARAHAPSAAAALARSSTRSLCAATKSAMQTTLYSKSTSFKDDGASLTETQRLFKSVQSDTTRPLFPRTVTIEHVLRDGQRTRVPNAKPQELFGNLPQRTSQLVQMTRSDRAIGAARRGSKAEEAKMSIANRAMRATHTGAHASPIQHAAPIAQPSGGDKTDAPFAV